MAKKQRYCQRDIFDAPGFITGEPGDQKCINQCNACKDYEEEFNAEIEDDQDPDPEDLEEDPDEPEF